MKTMRDILDEIDRECKEAGLPPLSWLVTDIPGRKNATEEQKQQVYAAAQDSRYEAMFAKLKNLLN